MAGEGMTMLRIMTALTLFVPVIFLAADTHAQEIDFDQINKFESVGKGALNVGEPPKTIIDDGERHIVILTIWEADAETKVYWKPPDAEAPRTTVIPGTGPPVNSNSRRLASPIAKSNSAMCCLV
jgi:hypothetical protein